MQSLVSVLALIGLAACSPAAPSPAAPPAAAPAGPTAEKRAANQTLNVAQVGLPATMSPESSAANYQLYGAMYDAMTVLDAKANIVPAAATKWSQTDPTTWRFNLRNDMTFSNGDKLTAADVEFTLNKIVADKMPQISLMNNLTGAKMVDDYTVDVMTKVPDASILPGLSSGWIMPKAYYTTSGKDGFATKPIGSGPFQLTSYRASDMAVFKKRSTEHPYRKSVLADLTIRSITEQNQMVNGLQTGDLDVLQGFILGDTADQIAKNIPGANVQYRVTNNFSALISQPENKQRNTPLTDIRVRWALSYAVDKEAMAKNLYKGYAKATGQLTVPDSPAWDDSIQPVPYDPAMAKKLLADAGYPNGFKLPVGIDYTTNVDPKLVLALQSNLRDVGIEASANMYELAAFLDKYYGRNGQTKGDLFIQTTGDGNGFMTQAQGLYSCNIPLVWWCNPEFDKNMALANSEPDVQKRGVLMKKAIRAFYDDVAHINLVIAPTFVISGPKAKGFVWGHTSAFFYDSFYKVE
jgi:peptide/nickel transport system substrate-binding protein